MTGPKSGVYPQPDLLMAADMREALGLPSGRDTVLIARSSGIGIWHTEKTAGRDVPSWLPPFGQRGAIYRGFRATRLRAVLETGLDAPAQSAFYATDERDKAWQYPVGRRIPTMLVLDGELVEASYEPEPTHPTGAPGDVNSPNIYTEGEIRVRTRFDLSRRVPNDESRYGHWVPGDARAALLGVVIGGPQSTVVPMLQELDVEMLCTLR